MLKGKVVIVTGSRRGIGRGTVDSLIAHGACVVGCAKGPDPEFEVNGQTIYRADINAYYYSRCDVADPKQVEEFIHWVAEKFGRIDCLVNNAGVHPPTRSIDEFSVEEFLELFNVNVMSMFVASKTALPYLRKTRGCIINMGSLVGIQGQEGATIYCATKGAISGFTKALAVDEGQYGVRVNAVLPGTIYTPSANVWASAFPDPEAKLAEIGSWCWLNRQGTLKEAGDCVAFLASDMAGYVTGHELIVSGGAELAYGIKTGAKGPQKNSD